MLIFSDDGCVRVAESEAQVIRDCEGVDVQSGVWWFFDAAGRALVPVFDDPVNENRVLGLLRTVVSGRFHLELAGAARPSEADPLWLSLLEASALEPNPHFESLEQLKTALRSKGAPVDRPA